VEKESFLSSPEVHKIKPILVLKVVPHLNIIPDKMKFLSFLGGKIIK